MRTERCGRWVLGMIVVVGLAACGGGGGGDGGQDVSGWWLVEGRPGGSSGAYEAMLIVQLAMQDGSIWANGSEFVPTGSGYLSVEPSAADPDREEITITVVSNDELSGWMDRYNAGVVVESTDLRLTRTSTPSGTLTMTGTVDGAAVDVSTTTAWGALESTPATETRFTITYSTVFVRETQLRVTLGAEPLTVGTYILGLLDSASVSSGDNEDDATGGSVTFTSVSGGRLVGTYTLNLSGGSVTGAFDAAMLLDRLP